MKELTYAPAETPADIHAWPGLIARLRKASREADEQVTLASDARRKLRKQFEREIKLARQKDDPDKPLYSNDAARAAALEDKLENSQRYLVSGDKLRMLESYQFDLRTDLTRVEQLYEIALVDYEYERLGRRRAG